MRWRRPERLAVSAGAVACDRAAYHQPARNGGPAAAQPPSQATPGAGQAAGDGSFSQTEGAGRFGVGLAPEVAKHHRQAVFVRQPAHLFVQYRQQLVPSLVCGGDGDTTSAKGFSLARFRAETARTLRAVREATP